MRCLRARLSRGLSFLKSTFFQEVSHGIPQFAEDTSLTRLRPDSNGRFLNDRYAGHALSSTNLRSSIYLQGPPDGSNPQGGLLRDNEGNLYGTTAAGGSLGGGTVYKLSPSGVVTVLHNFGAAGDGASPLAGLVRDAEGNFYGTTQKGGDSACGSGSGCGTVFKVDPSGNETVLHNFGESSGDGLYPSASLVLADGIFFGTTS